MSDEQTTPTPPEQAPPSAPGTAPTGGTGERMFTQAELDAIVRDRLERSKRAAEAAQQKAAEEAKAAALKEQGEFKALYEQEAAKAATLAQQAEAAARYEGALRKLLASQREGLPDYIIPLLDTMDPAAQLEYLAEHGPKLRAPAAPPTPPTPPRGVPAPARPPTAPQGTPPPTQRQRPLTKF